MASFQAQGGLTDVKRVAQQGHASFQGDGNLGLDVAREHETSGHCVGTPETTQ